ncbi:MAG: YibE/F family protein [Candidatus Taylorbacteria bacterium]|nr:YibE/F family protein [Candidatus Taylorbacteria bacterium]
MNKFVYASLIGLLCLIPNITFGAEIIHDTEKSYVARVVSIDSEVESITPGLGLKGLQQTLTVEITEGLERGKQISVSNDYMRLSAGDKIFLLETTRTEDGAKLYSVQDPYRLNFLIALGVIFIILVIIFGGMQGVRGLVSLLGSLVLILGVLLPGILHGYQPVLMSIFVSSLIIVVGSYVTHGWNRTTSSAVVGMILTVIVTGVFGYFAVLGTHLSGFESDEAIYLNMSTGGSLNFTGLLFGGIMIGLLGVLYDVAIGQAVSVEELHALGPHISRTKIYRRALRMGREHIGALVNTLAIAYVGASLPLLLLFFASNAPVALTLNKEIFSTEIVRTLVGSIGLVLAVPITTYISVVMLVKKNPHSEENSEQNIKAELAAIDGHQHHH